MGWRERGGRRRLPPPQSLRVMGILTSGRADRPGYRARGEGAGFFGGFSPETEVTRCALLTLYLWDLAPRGRNAPSPVAAPLVERFLPSRYRGLLPPQSRSRTSLSPPRFLPKVHEGGGPRSIHAPPRHNLLKERVSPPDNGLCKPLRLLLFPHPRSGRLHHAAR